MFRIVIGMYIVFLSACTQKDTQESEIDSDMETAAETELVTPEDSSEETTNSDETKVRNTLLTNSPAPIHNSTKYHPSENVVSQYLCFDNIQINPYA